MKRLKYLLDFLVIFLIFDAFIILKNYIIAIPLFCLYIAYKLYQSKSSIYAFKGNLSFEKKEYAAALSYYSKACLNVNVDSAIKLKYAYILLYCGKLKACDEILKTISFENLELNLKNSYIITEALYLWKTGDLKSAIEKCKNIDIEFKNTLIYETLGYLFILNGNYSEALEYNKTAYDYNSSSLVIADNLAQCYYFLENYEKAQGIYENILINNPTKPTFSEPYYYYGLILKSKGDIDNSLKYFNIALSMRESFLSALPHNKIKDEINLIDLSIQH
ncbi:hypothetical protein JCM1393_03440 [Clostridium carnis]